MMKKKDSFFASLAGKSMDIGRILVLAFGLMLVCMGSVQAEEAVEEPEAEEIIHHTEAAPDSKARLEILDDHFQFGTLKSGVVELVTHTFRFKNAGTEDLLLMRIKPSCGCTSAIPSATRVAPGQEATLTAALNPKGKSGEQVIRVRTEWNDPNNKEHEFKMSGFILADWRVIPTYLDFGRVGENEVVTRQVTVNSQYAEGDPIRKIKALRPSSPEISAVTRPFEVPASPSKDQKWVEVNRPLDVTLKAGATRGDFRKDLHIVTDDPESPTHTVIVVWTVEGDLHFQPARVFTSMVRGKAIQRPLVIETRSGTPFEILSIDIQGKTDEKDIELIPNGEQSPSRKNFFVSPLEKSDKRDQTMVGKIVIQTNLPGSPVVEIPYTSVVKY